MNISIAAEEYAAHPCPALVVGCVEDDFPADELLAPLDRLLGGGIAALRASGEFSGRLNRVKLLHTFGRLPAERLILVGVGKRGELTAERLRQAAGSAVRAAAVAGITRLSSVLHRAAAIDGSLAACVEGFILGGYSFSHYKTLPADERPVEGVTLLLPAGAAMGESEREAGEAATLCEAVCFARDLVSHPGNVATPSYLAEKALELSGRHGISCCVLDRDEMERLSMEGILSVAKGSHQPPRFIILEYLAGPPGKRPTVLVGKGVTFDSGGISLKPREGMERMKDDMAGAAAVMGTLMAAAGLRLPVNLVGLIPTAENLPGGGAYKPGDIVRTMAGKTVEIVNTDAEGRMLLCDALHYAQRYKPAALIDLATLTGACLVALGTIATGAMGNDPALLRGLKTAGETTGERIWELPLWDEYGELMKSDVADMKNAGGPHAGTVSAAWFLKQFAGKAKWVHLDIAGTAWEEKGRPYLPKGATGVGIRLLVEFLRRSGG
ncbi:leucyl aminopeptidase [Geobacter pickeringii]|uniref:Probable cytosol aminopeptidase n=1 Tax=Geobacter pickeringii TaxID=345632 RepID=A0A0B5B6H2_9BACT|nr:leucyl aminopeptidase [Geobacter pickeringii]AJE02128.1 peptidase M17 [Geobacter pickeringii]